MLNKESNSLKKSYWILLGTFFLIVNSVLNIFPVIDIRQSSSISGVIFLTFVASIFTSIFFYIECKKKKGIEENLLVQMRSEFNVFMVEDDKVWFYGADKIFSISPDEITDEFISKLLIND